MKGIGRKTGRNVDYVQPVCMVYYQIPITHVSLKAMNKTASSEYGKALCNRTHTVFSPKSPSPGQYGLRGFYLNDALRVTGSKLNANQLLNMLHGDQSSFPVHVPAAFSLD